jgi:hypothetical protein
MKTLLASLAVLVTAPVLATDHWAELPPPPRAGTPLHAEWCDNLNCAARSLAAVLDMAMKETPGRGNPKADAFANQVAAVLMAEKAAGCPAR